MPCGSDPIPYYPRLGDAVVVKSWKKSDLGTDWKPPACSGWTETGFTTLVSIAARFSYGSDASRLLEHIGDISGLAGMRYWSATHKQWRMLVAEAHAVTDLENTQPRKNFTDGEIKNGATLYYEQTDNLSGKVLYRMDIVDASATRVVFRSQNVSTLRYHFIPVLHPGELQSIYFMDRESDTVWRFYSLVRTGKNASGLIDHNESSFINRALAFYCHFVTIPPVQELPREERVRHR